MEIYDQFKEYRETIGMKQKDAAKLLKLEPTTLSKYENGVTLIPLATAVEMCNVYNMKPEDFLKILFGQRLVLPTGIALTKEQQAMYVDSHVQEILSDMKKYPEMLEFYEIINEASPDQQEHLTKMLRGFIDYIKS